MEEAAAPMSRIKAEAEALEKAAEAIQKAVGPTLWPGHCRPAADAAITAYVQHMDGWKAQRKAYDERLLQVSESRMNYTLKKAQE